MRISDLISDVCSSDLNLRETAPLELLVGDQSTPRVEEENAQNLVGEASHRYDEIATERRVGWIDPVALEITVHRCKNGAERQRGEWGKRVSVCVDLGGGRI